MQNSHKLIALIPVILTSYFGDFAKAQSVSAPPEMHQVTPWTPRTAGTRPPLGPVGPKLIPLNTSSWTPIGPAPLNSNSVFGNVSGRITAIAAHAVDPLTIY